MYQDFDMIYQDEETACEAIDNVFTQNGYEIRYPDGDSDANYSYVDVENAVRFSRRSNHSNEQPPFLYAIYRDGGAFSLSDSIRSTHRLEAECRTRATGDVSRLS